MYIIPDLLEKSTKINEKKAVFIMSENNIEKFIKIDFMEFIDSEENQEDKIESLVKPSKEFYAVFNELIERLKKANLYEEYQPYLFNLESLKTSTSNELVYYYYLEGFKRGLKFMKDIEQISK